MDVGSSSVLASQSLSWCSFQEPKWYILNLQKWYVYHFLCYPHLYGYAHHSCYFLQINILQQDTSIFCHWDNLPAQVLEPDDVVS